MSQRAATRGFFLCILAVFTAFPAGAQTGPGTITFSPATFTFGIGETSGLVTAQVVFAVGTGLPGGLQTLQFDPPYGLPYGVTTVPSPVTYTTAPGQTSATVSFRLVAAPFAWAGSRVVYVSNTPTPAGTGVLNYFIEYLSVVPASLRVATGSTSASLTTTVSYGEVTPTGPQQLVFTGLPAGATAVPSPVTFTVPPQQSYGVVSFRIAVSASTRAGTYQVTVETSPYSTATDTFTLIVQKLGALSAVLEKTVVDACPGGAPVPNSVLISPLDGYTGLPTVTFPALPSDLKVTPTSIPVGALPPSRTIAFEVSALAGALPGQKVVNVLVRDAGGPFGTASFVVNVGAAGFSPVVSPASIALISGGDEVTVTASLAPDACSPPSTITVTPSGLPAGVTVTPASAVLVAPSYTPVVFTFSASALVPTGSMEITFTFTPSTGAPKTTTTPVSVVRNGNIGVEVERASMDVCPGGAVGPNSLTITSLDGYTGSPTVTFPTLPAGITVSPATIPVPLLPPARIIVFTVSAAPGMAPGPVTVTALVSDPRGITTTATFVANALPPALNPAVAPAAVTLNAGGASAALTATLVAGDCVPTSNVTVTPSGLPPGVTVTPTSAVLAPPAFAPAAFSFQASSSAAPGPTTITFTYVPVGGFSKVATAVITVCGPPAAPVSPVIRPRGNPQGPVTATDLLALEWGAPASGFPPTRYEWRINGGTWNSAAGTSASAPPRGAVDPVQLFVRGYACNPERGPGVEASSPVYALSAPVASFTVPASIVAGRAVTFTDTSSPQATSWLWFPGDGIPATTVQSPTVTFPAAGPKVIVLVASNGSGTSSKATTVTVLPASTQRAATGFGIRLMEREPDGWLALGRVDVGAGTTLLLRRLEGEGEAVAFLRLVDGDGKAVVERRLVLAAGEEARHDLSAWGASGVFRVELVGPEGLEAAVEEMAVPFGGPERPVTPRRPPSAEIR